MLRPSLHETSCGFRLRRHGASGCGPVERTPGQFRRGCAAHEYEAPGALHAAADQYTAQRRERDPDADPDKDETPRYRDSDADQHAHANFDAFRNANDDWAGKLP